MKHNKDQYQLRGNYPQESPQLFQDRQSIAHDVQHISPIQNQHWRESELYSQNLNDRQKSSERGKDGLNRMANKGHNENHFIDIETPNTLAKEFYSRPHAQRNIGDDDFLNEQYEEDDNSAKGEFASNNKNPQYPSNADRFQRLAHSKGVLQQKTDNQKIKGNIETTDFDLTAKEITSNKRFEKGKIKQIVGGGRTSQSPGEGAPSNSETVKWAFSNKDSQETQKKISVINREVTNARDLISKSLKNHDSRSNGQQQQSSNAAIKGKVLDFGNLDNSKNVDSGLFFNNRDLHDKYLQGTIDESLVGRQGEGKQIISFLEEDDDLLINGQRINYTSNRNGYVSATKNKGFNLKNGKISNLLQGIIDNTMDCPLCNCQKVFDSSLNCSKLEDAKSRGDIIKENLEKKYLTSREYYNVKIINDVIYNENTHIVSVFKDYLIYDDVSEFLKRFYHKSEGVQRLPKMYEFYEKYSKVFPNYVSLPESKYMFKNIERKQRLYDEKQRIVMEQQEREERKANGEFELGNSAERRGGRHKDRFSSQNTGRDSSGISNLSGNRMFDTRFVESVANIQPSGFIDQSSMHSSMHASRLQEHVMNSSILIHQHLHDNMQKAKNKRHKKGVEDLDMGELISKFIARDSQSQIQSSQSSIMPEPEKIQPAPIIQQKQQNVKQQNEAMKKPVYEYQEQRNIQPPSNIQSVQSESSKSIVDTSQRPTSGKLNRLAQENGKRLSTGSNKEQKPLKEQQIMNDPNVLSTDGKILNYNICNNYNQYLCPNHEFLPQNHFINNENFYMQQPPSEVKQEKTMGMQRNQSKSNLHPPQNTAKDSCQTPLKGINRHEMKTPISGEGDRRFSMENKLANRQQENQQEYFSQGLNLLQDQKNMIAILFLNNQQQQQQQQKQDTSHSSANQLSEKQITSPVGLNVQQKIPQQKLKIVSRDQSKERMQQQTQLQNLKQPSFNNQGNQQRQEVQKQMFKNEILSNIGGKELSHESNSQDQEYNTISSQGQGVNVRSIEKFKQIEDEIEKDYSKYINEYGLTKTAFAKAVNALREKNNSAQSQQVQVVPLTTRQNKGNQNSNEKFRPTQIRSSSTSQQRKSSGARPIFSKVNGQETVSDLYLNTNKNQSQKMIRTVRAKTHINSQNSSACNQRSQRLSPDKNYMISSSNNFGSNQNLLAFNQTATPQQKQTQATYVTLKAQQQKQQTKGIKIKFPLNSQRGQQNQVKLQGQGNTNISSNQTPKRIKLQKTKSTSNIPLCFTQRGLPSNFLSSTRGRGAEMVILDEMNGKESNQIHPINSLMRQSQNFLAQSGIGLGEQYASQQDGLIQNQLYPQGTFASSSCGTYATTSILNSPLSFKGQQQPQNNLKNSVKGRQSSRNGGSSQHQSQKSIGGNHQRSGSNTGNTVLISSNSKIKTKESKRLSSGSNLSKKSSSQQAQSHHQPSQSNIQQQILQLLMSYQQQNQQDQLDNTGLSHQQIAPLSQTLKNLQQNSASMKDLKSMRNPTNYIIQENPQPIPSKNKIIAQGALIQQQMTARGLQPQASILMVNQNFRKNSKSGKNTTRGDQKKRQTIGGGPYQMNEAPSQTSTNQYSNFNGTGQEISSRIIDSQYMNDGQKKVLSFSKSQDNFDMIKLAAQRAAIEQQQQQLQLSNQFNQSQNFQQPLKFLQNLKQAEGQQQMLKIKLAPQSSQQSLQSARNLQFDNSSSVLKQFRATPVNDYESSQSLQSKQPTNIIIQTSSQIEKPTSRRTSAKFNPSSAKNKNQ